MSASGLTRISGKKKTQAARELCEAMRKKIERKKLMADILENLNERQREAVLETEGYVRVIAGAGSGKTKLLVSRYAYLVQDYGIDSANILCVTFTNKAAGEMKKRIQALIGEDDSLSLICTYHGFCNKLLRENPEKLFLNRQFQIIDSYQQKAVLGEIYEKFELKLDHAAFESILRKIGYAKRNREYVAKLCNPQPCQILEEIRDQDDRIIEEFLQRQKATYSLDFHDLISFAIYLLETDSEVREKWQNRLNYIMVDEFQDSSAVEMRLVEILSGQYGNLMIVGDPDQNIYEWRGSDVKLLVDFDKEHQPTKTIILNQNYRSTPQILRCANTLIEKNELRLKKDLFTKNAAGEPVVHYHAKDEYEEMDQVVGNINMLHEKKGFRYSDFAIIYRSSFLSRVAEKKLVEKNIPYEVFGGVRFYQRMEILDVLAYLRLIAYGEDTDFRRIVNKPRRRFGRGKMNLLEELRQQDETLLSTLSGHLEEKEFQSSEAGAFVRLIEDMQGSYRTKRISDIVNEVTLRSGYESYIRELGDGERLDNLAEFKRIANEFEREFGENISLEDFLRQIALQSGEETEENRDSVKLMTIHSSKGLEFPVVFILGFTEGVFPSAKTLGERKHLGLEEERRLCYVAITRAEKYLFLMEAEGVSQNGMKNLVSRFLEEIGEENYVRIGRIPEKLKQESRKYTAKLNHEMQTEAAVSRKIGDRVEHHIFGPGKIEAIDEKRGSYSIRFEKNKQIRNISSNYFTREHGNAARKGEGLNQETVVAVKPADQADPATGSNETGSNETGRNEAGGSEIGSSETGSSEIGSNKTRSSEIGSNETRNSEIGSNTTGSSETGSNETRNSETGRNATGSSETGSNETRSSEIGSNTTGSNETESDETESGGKEAQAARLKTLKENSPNLWKHMEVPHSGWTCTGVEDLGAPVGICEMCGYQIIRYAHHMQHKEYRSLSVGCVCAGRMEGNIAQAKRREAEFKKRRR